MKEPQPAEEKRAEKMVPMTKRTKSACAATVAMMLFLQLRAADESMFLAFQCNKNVSGAALVADFELEAMIVAFGASNHHAVPHKKLMQSIQWW